MDQSEIKNKILSHLKGFNPIMVGIFGSFARGDNKKGSDIDILVEFKEAPSLLTLIKLENDLSEILGVKVDLVTTGALKNKRIKKSIQKDLINMIKDDLAYIEHILDCIRKINEFSKGLSLKEFKTNEMVQDAIIRNIEIIGEASKKISKDTKQTYYKIPWKEISGMRDKLIHDYLGVDITVVWNTIHQDIPTLEKLISEIDK